MTAVETNILVYAHRTDSPMHDAADRCLTELAESGLPWAIPWPCIHEFLAITTHPKIYRPSTPLDDAIAQVQCWMEAPSLVLIGEGADYWQTLERTLRAGNVMGPRVHDARIAAICVQHGVTELWSADRDLARFPELNVRNPLADP
jgi:uncharacterized protein